MKSTSASLREIATTLRERVELDYKRDIQLAAGVLGRVATSEWFPSPNPIENGDDTAVLEGLGDLLLFAAEGIREDLVASDPWFAGFCGVLTNVNDVVAMGGRPWALVDVLFRGEGNDLRVLEGIAAAAKLLGVAIVGGHTSRTATRSMLAVAIVGRARRITPSTSARPGHVLLTALALDGHFRGDGIAFDAITTASRQRARAPLAAMAELAEGGLVHACKDISMAGMCGTLAMMLESSRCGATLDIAAIPAPDGVDPVRWLRAFPSFGFLMAVDPKDAPLVCAQLDRVAVNCAQVGAFDDTSTLLLRWGADTALFSDWRVESLTGFGP